MPHQLMAENCDNSLLYFLQTMKLYLAFTKLKYILYIYIGICPYDSATVFSCARRARLAVKQRWSENLWLIERNIPHMCRSMEKKNPSSTHPIDKITFLLRKMLVEDVWLAGNSLHSKRKKKINNSLKIKPVFYVHYFHEN